MMTADDPRAIHLVSVFQVVDRSSLQIIRFSPSATYQPLHRLTMRSGPFFPYFIKYPTHHSVLVNVTLPSYTYSEYIIHIATF